ncbi:cupredoxin domain-containing protein [Rhodovarius lipocyclicus]|uniref:cupredoxin domain-containing protein n=1 Tax=Rhodovarius lipocyclicus TaxID=268410 RepID=UPI001357ACD7|nr:plastocyanin/azurin family copper-binding protein [Rhodovarius lipocyclicus]
MTTTTRRPLAWGVAAALALLAPFASVPAAAAPDGHGNQSELLGVPAPRGQGRVIRIEMTDNAYSVPRIQVRAGETIRFVAVNKGTLLHEFSFAPAETHAAHRPEMAMMMEHGMITPERVVNLRMAMPGGHNMDHTAPNTVLVEPGRTGEISWRFDRAGTIEIACNIPGHFESGMRADLVVTPR